jgi:hypothetical protein
MAGRRARRTQQGGEEETMATDAKMGPKPHNEKSGQRRKAKSDRVGEVRCLNCFARFRPPSGAEKAPCPACGWEWYISWAGKLAKIRKPVWASWERQMTEAQQDDER